MERDVEELPKILSAIEAAASIGCLTGAGVSTLSGIPDFRGPQGLYRQKDAERIFDVDWFDRDPSIYYRGAAELVYALDRFEPGPVHRALRLLEDRGKLRGIATQNIDMLHQKAGSKNVWEVHGSPMLHHCRRCGREASFAEVLAQVRSGRDGATRDAVPRCPCGGVYKPDITFFGEALPEVAFSRARQLATSCELFLVLGTSLTVYPAAQLPEVALGAGARVVIVNAQPTALDGRAYAVCRDLGEFAAAILGKGAK